MECGRRCVERLQSITVIRLPDDFFLPNSLLCFRTLVQLWTKLRDSVAFGQIEQCGSRDGSMKANIFRLLGWAQKSRVSKTNRSFLTTGNRVFLLAQSHSYRHYTQEVLLWNVTSLSILALTVSDGLTDQTLYPVTLPSRQAVGRAQTGEKRV